MREFKSRAELQALCVTALRATQSYADARAVVIVEISVNGLEPNWDVTAIDPKPPLHRLRIGEAEIALAPLRQRYRLVRAR